MGTRIASGTKPTMLAKTVPGMGEQESVQKDIASSVPSKKIQTSQPKAQEPMAEDGGGDIMDMSFSDFGTEAPAPVQTQETPVAAAPAAEAAPVEQVSDDILDMPVSVPTIEKKSKNYLFDLQESKEPFEGTVAGIKFKRDKDGQYYYYQTGSKFKGDYKTRGITSKEFGEVDGVKSEIEKAGWKPISELDSQSRNYLNVASSVMLDWPELATGLGVAIPVGMATGGMGFFPALFAEMIAGGVSGYLGGSLAEDKYKTMLQNKEDSKKLAFLEAVLSSPAKPTPATTAALFGAGGALIPAGFAGAVKGYSKASELFASQMARLKPYMQTVLNEIGDFAEKMGVQLDAKDIVRQIDPKIESKIRTIESGDLGPLEQERLITQSQSKQVALRGILDAMMKRFAPEAAEIAEEAQSVGKLAAKEVVEDPFSRQVMKPRADMNIMDVVEDNMKSTLSQNAMRGRELAGDFRFSAEGLVNAVDEILERSFDSFKQMKAAGASQAEILNEFRLRNPKGAEEFARFYNNLRTMTTRGPSALQSPADTQFIETVFEAMHPEQFKSKVVQEQLTTMRHPIEPPGIGGGQEYVGEAFPFMDQPDRFHTFTRPQYTDPTTGKTVYGRGDLQQRNYYVLGGPRGQPGARMGQIGQPVPGQAGRVPGGPSGVIQEGAGQIQDTLFSSPVGSAGGPKMVETPAKRFLPPTKGGESYSGLTFNQLNELNDQAQALVESLKAGGDTKMLGVASAIEKATRNFEDDALFKLGVVRGDEAFAEKVIADKAKYANAAKDITEFRGIFDKNMDGIAGQILNLKPQMTQRLLTYLEPSQVQQIKGLVLDRAYRDSISDVLETGVHLKVDPEKIVTKMLTEPETRENISILFGKEGLRELDSFANLAKVVNSTGNYTASKKAIEKSVSRFVRWTEAGEQARDFLGAFFKGNPTAQRVIDTSLRDAQVLIRRPEGGVLGKIQKAAYKAQMAAGRGANVAASAAGKIIPQTARMAPSKYKTQEEINKELSFGEMGK